MVSIDSRYKVEGHSGNFLAKLDRRVNGVVGARILNASIPQSFYTVVDGDNVLCITAKIGSVGGLENHEITIMENNYTATTFAAMMQAKLQAEFNVTTLFVIYHADTDLMEIQLDPAGGNDVTKMIMYGTMHPDVSDTSPTIGRIMGIKPGTHIESEQLTVGGEWGVFFSNARVDIMGGTNMVYLTSPTLFDGACMCSNNPVLNHGMMARIPVEYGAPGEEVSNVEYTPTASQMYNFQYNKPRSFDYIHMIAYAHRDKTNSEPGGYYEIDFEGHEVEITVELVILDVI